MSLSGLTKEQKQYLVLAILGVIIFVVVAVIGVKFSLSSISEAKQELNDLKTKIDSADRTLARRKQTSGDFRHTIQVLKKHLKNAPPERNYYSWATEVIYSKAREAGLEVDTIDELNVAQNKPGKKGGSSIRFESYSLRIMSHGGYNNAKAFIKSILQDYPLVRFAGIDINASAKPDVHDIQIFMQWPFNLNAIAKNWDSIESKAHDLAMEQVADGTRELKSEPPVATVRASSTPGTSAGSAAPKTVPPQKRQARAPASRPTPPPPRKPVSPAKKTASVAPKELEPSIVPPPRHKPPVTVAPKADANVRSYIPKEPAPVEKQPQPTAKPVVAVKKKQTVEPVVVAQSVEPKKDAVEAMPVPTNQTTTPVETTEKPQIAEAKPEVAVPENKNVSTEPVKTLPPAQEQSIKPKENQVITTSDTTPEETVEPKIGGTDSPPAEVSGTPVSEKESPVTRKASGTNTKYVSTEKSAQKLKAILIKSSHHTTASLNSLLDNLLEDTNETK